MVDKTVKISVDSSEAGKFQSDFRRDAEQMARDMIRSSRQYSTSSKEVLKDIEDQIRAIEKRNKLDAEFRRIRLESLRERGDVSGAQYTQASRGLINEYRQDELQTRLLREIIDTIVRTSKEEIREDRSTVEKTVRESKTVGQYGITGDEKQALKETIQRGIIGDQTIVEEIEKRKFNLAKYVNTAMSAGGALGSGDLGGLAMMGGRGLMSGMGSVGVAGGLGIAGGAGILALLAGAFSSNKDIAEKSRPYMIASQTGMGGVFGELERYNKMGFYNLGMKPFEGMSLNADLRKASGGRIFNEYEMLGYAGLTRSRDVSSELLNTTITNQRYSTGGDAMAIVTSLERTLEKMYPKNFRDKLVQLPEMMGVYNSLAQQMIQTTGKIDSNALAGFVGGIKEGFGVEGINLQRYVGGMFEAFKGSSNPYLKKMQYAALRKTNPNIGYHEALEIFENPTSNLDYMRNFYDIMRGQGLTQFKSWLRPMKFGEKEMREIFESNDFSKVLDRAKEINKDKTSHKEDYEKFYKAGQDFYAASEKQMEEISSFFREFKKDLGEIYEKSTTKGVAEGFKNFNAQGGVMSVKEVGKFR